MQNTINRLGWVVAGVLALFFVAAITGVVSGGPLDPPGAPAPTQPQVEPRSPIPPVGWNGTFPIVISETGSYFLTRSLTGTSGNDGIQITNGDVSLDLNGFNLTGGSNPGDSGGIAVIGLHANIHISNGVIRGWNTGINGWSTDGQAVFSRVDHINAFDNVDVGIRLGYDSEVLDCNASQNNIGIYTHYSVVRGCHVTDNTGYGIYGEDVSLIEGNKLWNNYIGIALSYSGAQPGNNTVRSNTSTNNTVFDIQSLGTGNLGDDNVVTCPGWVIGVITQYNTKYQRNPC